MKTADELIQSVELWADQRNLLTPDKRHDEEAKAVDNRLHTAHAVLNNTYYEQ